MKISNFVTVVCNWILIWGLAVLLGIFGSVWLSLNIWRHYNESPTTISMERNFMDWSTPLPAATLCPAEKVAEDKLQAYVDRLKGVDNKEEMKDFLRRLANATYENFKYMTDIPNNPIKSDEYMNAILEIRKEMSFITYNTESAWDPESVVTVTELGICCTYNTRVAIYNNPEYWAQNNWSIITHDKVPLKGHPVTGPIYGIFDSLRGKGVKFFYHSPYDVLDASYKGFIISENKIKIMGLGALSTYTTEEARELDVHQRKCRFPEDNNLRISPVYTFNFCQMECRMKIARGFCGCVPHFYRKIGNAKICDVQGMRCVGNHSEQMVKLMEPAIRKRYPCNCLPDCDQVSYILESHTKTQSNILEIGTGLQYGIEKYPRMRLKRDVIFGFADLWASIGSTGGLFLGCSILSIIEIFYFFTIRLFIYVMGIYREKRDRRFPKERLNYL